MLNEPVHELFGNERVKNKMKWLERQLVPNQQVHVRAEIKEGKMKWSEG